MPHRLPCDCFRRSPPWPRRSRASKRVWGVDCFREKRHYVQVWQSVSNLCVTGLTLWDGWDKMLPARVRTPPGHKATGHGCPYRGGVNDPTYRFLQSLPTDPHALLGLIEREMQGHLPRPEEAFVTIGQLLGTAANPPPPVSAALYRAAALIPGVTVVADATDAIGRHGVAVALTSQDIRAEWIFSRQTLLYLGARYFDGWNGATWRTEAVLQRAFVDRVGQLPG